MNPTAACQTNTNKKKNKGISGRTAEHGELVYRNDGYVEEVSTTSIEPLYAELEHFLKCVQGKEIPEVDGEQASRALKIADFIESAVENSGDAILLENPV